MRARSGIPRVRAHEGDGVVVVQRPEKIGLQILRPRDNVARENAKHGFAASCGV